MVEAKGKAGNMVGGGGITFDDIADEDDVSLLSINSQFNCLERS